MGLGGISIWQIIIILFLVVVPLLMFRKIAKKAGYSGWWSLIMLIPLLNFAMIWVFALVEWPIERDQSFSNESI